MYEHLNFLFGLMLVVACSVMFYALQSAIGRKPGTSNTMRNRKDLN